MNTVIERRIYGILQQSADANGITSITDQQIAAAYGVSTRHVKKILKLLEYAGYIEPHYATANLRGRTIKLLGVPFGGGRVRYA